MREIKFRAWDKKEKMMAMNVPFHEDNIGVFKIMQFTGLKDENGKEIYEGDIIPTGFSKAVVNFANGRFFLKLINKLYYDLDLTNNRYDSNCKFEVIGNVHENPELLEDGK